MPTYKLMYLNGRGRGEVARMLFYLKGQVFEDCRFELCDYLSIKGDRKLFPLGGAPVLFIDGQVMPQSKAISRYLAREFGYYGLNNMDAAHIDVICETATEIYLKLVSIFSVRDDAKRAELKKEFKENTSKPYFTFLEDSIRKAGGEYFLGKSLTLADMEVFNILEQFLINTLKIEGVVEHYPDLLKFYKGIKEYSALKPYLESRPFTSM